jgi:predicted O-methyltransferase YrrM
MSGPNILLRLKKRARRFLTPWLIAGLERSDNPGLQKLGAAVRLTFSKALTPEERRWVKSIELWRQELISSNEEVVVVDYGAGFPSEERSLEQMNRGVTTVEIVGEACMQYSKQQVWTTLLFHLIREFRPVACVELGTCLGVSAAYQGAALELNGAGRMVTLEGSVAFAEIASDGLQRLALNNWVQVIEGRFQDTLEGVLHRLGTVDYAFIDGHHDENATIGYFEQFLPRLADRAILIFDDIHDYTGMQRAWRRICAHPKVDIALDLSIFGVCLLGAGAKLQQRLLIA